MTMGGWLAKGIQIYHLPVWVILAGWIGAKLNDPFTAVGNLASRSGRKVHTECASLICLICLGPSSGHNTDLNMIVNLPPLPARYPKIHLN